VVLIRIEAKTRNAMLALTLQPKPLTIRQIAESIERKPMHLAAEKRMTELVEERSALTQRKILLLELKTLPRAEIASIADEIEGNDAERRELRIGLNDMREAHAMSIAAALIPMRREAAERLLSFLSGVPASIAADVAVLNESAAAIEQNGVVGRAMQIPPIDFSGVNARLKAIITRSGGVI
jgi:hypothetical protein